MLPWAEGNANVQSESGSQIANKRGGSHKDGPEELE